MAYNPNSYFNYEAGRGSIYSSPPKSKPKNANEQAAKSMGSAGIGGLGGKPTTTAAKKIQDNFRRETQKDSGSTYDEIALPTEEKVDKAIKGLGSPDKSDDDKDQSPIERIKSTLDSVSEMMGLGKPEKPKRSAYTPDRIYSTAAFRARSNDPIDITAQNRRIDNALDFENRAPMAYLPVGGTYDEIKKQRGADERNQKKMAESINATIEQLYAANDPARQFYQSGVPMEQRLFAPELGYDEIALPSEATVDKKIKGLGARPDVTVTEPDYTVESGDTLSEIAQKNNTTVEELVRINNIEDKDIINVGQKIKLKDTSVDVPKVSVTELDAATGFEGMGPDPSEGKIIKTIENSLSDDDLGIPDTDDYMGYLPLTPAQRVLNKIAVGEGAVADKLQRQGKHGIGTTEYDMVYNYGDTLAPDKPITQMTVKEVFDYQKKLINATKGKVPGTTKGTSAVGKYQFVKTSLFGPNGTPEKPQKNYWADKLKLTPDMKFTPALQEKIARLALKETGYDNYVKGKKSQDATIDRIADIWASVEGNTYGQGTATTKAELASILDTVQPDYMTLGTP